MQSLLNEYLVATGSYDRAPVSRPSAGLEPARRRFGVRRHRRTR